MVWAPQRIIQIKRMLYAAVNTVPRTNIRASTIPMGPLHALSKIISFEKNPLRYGRPIRAMFAANLKLETSGTE